MKTDVKVIRSPFFYVGDKYKLMPQLKKLMPYDISTYYEPFVGGGSSLINTNASVYVANDIDKNVIDLHEAISEFSADPNKLFTKLFELIDSYELSCSFKGKTAPLELKKQYVKTYYSHYNKDAYARLRADYNKYQDDMLRLYLLLIYGFNHMIRYNNKGEFNLPVGNVDFNKNVYQALEEYLFFCSNHKIRFSNKDFKVFMSSQKYPTNSFVYCDPPYLISGSEYNKLWNIDQEKTLLSCLDNLDKRGVRFGITNLVHHKGQENLIFKEWMKKYQVYDISSNYISFNDNTIKRDSREVYVTNYVAI